ncbi:hypothetical protein KVT40_002905 [Elsinoe batatas]|uniref:Uncharacterized protein n=1 Tax=Elsinoe batatas TaxID=2601811 RepID=A0A8K0PEB7_9PEZI|nr:hypothetical protein KVT40_002905 [Elsinoe batatas]
MGCGMSSPAPSQGVRHPARPPPSQTRSNQTTSQLSSFNKDYGSPQLQPAHRQLKSETNAVGIPDFDDTFDRDSGYSSPVSTTTGAKILTKRFHKPASSIDANIPDFSNRPFGHSATAWSSTGTGPQPQALHRSPSKVNAAARMRSIDIMDTSKKAPAPVSPPKSPPEPSEPKGPAAFQRRMDKRNEWTQRGAVREGESDDGRSGYSDAVGMATRKVPMVSQNTTCASKVYQDKNE